MTPERARLLEAVAEAAGHVASMTAAAPFEVRLGILGAALSILRAHDAAPLVVGETVEIRAAVYEDLADGGYLIRNAEEEISPRYRRHIATFTARVPLPVVPVIAATVEEVKRDG